jgi:hypothetical protein
MRLRHCNSYSRVSDFETSTRKARARANLAGARAPAAPSPPANPGTPPAVPASPCTTKCCSCRADTDQVTMHNVSAKLCPHAASCTGVQHKLKAHFASDSGTPSAGATMPRPTLPLQMRKFTYLQTGCGASQFAGNRHPTVIVMALMTSSLWQSAYEAANRVPGSRGIAPFAFMTPALSSCACKDHSLTTMSSRWRRVPAPDAVAKRMTLTPVASKSPL